MGCSQCRFSSQGSGSSPSPAGCNVFSYHIDFEPMYATARRQNRQEHIISSLDAAIAVLDIAEKISGITPAKAAFSVVKEILTMIKVWSPLLGVGRSWAEMGVGYHDERGRLCRTCVDL